MSRAVEVFRALESEPILTDAGEAIAKASGESAAAVFARTGKYICLDKDACEASADPLLESFQRYGSLGTTLSKVARLRRGFRTPLQSRYESIMETGRTSCTQGDDPEADKNTGIIWEPAQWGSQMQNPPKKVGIRECYIARPGYVFCSVDFDGMELRTWSQSCLWAVGRSRMADVLNSGEDPHTDLGARLIGIDRDVARIGMRGAWSAGEIEAFKEGARQTGKIGNFGFPGGMGAQALVAQSWSLYRNRLGMDPARPELWTPAIALDYAKFLKRNWKAEWTEADAYFAWINWLCKENGGTATLVQFVSQRIRSKVKYTAACNSPFQGLAADAAKDAGWELARAMYLAERRSHLFGSRNVAFVHDEFIAEVPDHPEQRHLAAYEMSRIMCETAQRWVPDVQITATPTLMYSWSKKAKTKHDSRGLLIPSDTR
jgi:DNA polymerase-1